jgi:Lipid A 3-O-deacylase (PagL)
MKTASLGFPVLALLCLAFPPASVGQESSSQPSDEVLQGTRKPNYNDSFYHKNKLELSLETGWLPTNVPFVFDFLLGDGYNMTSLKYTLDPIFVSLRWQMDNVRGPGILRGNWELASSASFTVVSRGPETRYIAWDEGVRRNFVRRSGKVSPYFEGRLGLGHIDAKGPKGVVWAQGQDFTFTVMMGGGFRYNVSPRCALQAGMTYMHISNLYLSEPRYGDYGINVYGPIIGVEYALGRMHKAN